MRERSITRFRFLPGLEQLELILPLSAAAAHIARPSIGHKVESPPSAQGPAAQGIIATGGGGLQLASDHSVSPAAKKPNFGFLVYRITNPTVHVNTLTPPFTQVLVQAHQPVPGQVYNVLQVAVKNGTAQTFNSSSGFFVRFPGSTLSVPILTGNMTWKPGQDFVFYVLTKKYYPVPNQKTSGFEFSLGGAPSVAIPGPSGIFLRLKYNPATFARTLDWIVAYGPGAQGGKGIKYGMPDTAIYAFLSAKTEKMDFGGYF